MHNISPLSLERTHKCTYNQQLHKHIAFSLRLYRIFVFLPCHCESIIGFIRIIRNGIIPHCHYDRTNVHIERVMMLPERGWQFLIIEIVRVHNVRDYNHSEFSINAFVSDGGK